MTFDEFYGLADVFAAGKQTIKDKWGTDAKVAIEAIEYLEANVATYLIEYVENSHHESIKMFMERADDY